MPAQFRKAVLDNGVTLLVERHEYVRSVSLGVWVKSGSGIEKPKQNGISHFIEHMTFKGTETRSSLELATVLESLGGDLNAFTDREVTCYHATVLSEHVDIALDVLSDLVRKASFPKAEIEREKKVLLQELSMIEESPEENIHQIFFSNVWKDQPLGQPVIGTRKTIEGFNRANTVRYFEEHYRPDNLIIAVAGNVEFESVRERCERYFKFENYPKTLKTTSKVVPYRSVHKRATTNTDQLHLIVGFDGLCVKDPYRFDALVLNFYLGGGMSSRLFQEIREKAALAYTVDCDFIPFSEAGLFAIYLAMSPRSLGKCLEILAREIKALRTTPLEQRALDQVKSQIKGAVLLSSDQMESRQESLGRNEVFFGRQVSLEEVINEIDRVTVERVHEVAQKIFIPEKETTITLSKVKPKINEVTVFYD